MSRNTRFDNYFSNNRLYNQYFENVNNSNRIFSQIINIVQRQQTTYGLMIQDTIDANLINRTENISTASQYNSQITNNISLPNQQSDTSQQQSETHNRGNNLNTSSVLPYNNSADIFSNLLRNIGPNGEISFTYLLNERNNNSPREETMERPSLITVNNATEFLRYGDILDENKNTECPILHSSFSDDDNVIQIKHCKHIFNTNELLRWFNVNPCCPVCRYNINTYSNNAETSEVAQQNENVVSTENSELNESNEITNSHQSNENVGVYVSSQPSPSPPHPSQQSLSPSPSPPPPPPPHPQENLNSGNNFNNENHPIDNLISFGANILSDISNNITNNPEWHNIATTLNNEINNINSNPPSYSNSNNNIPFNVFSNLLNNPALYNVDYSFNNFGNI